MRRAKRVDVPLDLLLGYPLFGALCFLAGAIRVATWTIVPLLVAGSLAGAGFLFARFRDDRGVAREVVTPSRPWWPVIAVIAVFACAFVAAQAPATSLDELAYHLAVPHTWVLEGRAVELPLLSHSYFPLGIESADLPLLFSLGAMDGGVASHFLHLFAAIATALLVFRRSGSWLATAAIVTTPALAISAGWSLVDWPLAGLFVALYVALESDDRDTATAATAAGLLTKSTFLPFAIVAWVVARKRPRWPVLLGLVFFARNVILTGNPFAPFFGAGAPHVSGFRALALADYVFEGAFIDEALGAAIVALPVFASGAIALACIAMAVGLFFLAPSSRILVPFLVVPAMSAASELRRRVLAIVISIAVVVQVFMVVWFTARSGAFTLLAGSASEVEYLRAQRPSYAAVEWLNTQLPAGSRSLVVGQTESFWFTRPTRGGGNFDGPRVSRYLDVPAPEALRERLRRDGITHIAIVAAPLPTSVDAKREERQTTLSPGAQRMLAQLLDRYTAKVVTQGHATLFELR